MKYIRTKDGKICEKIKNSTPFTILVKWQKMTFPIDKTSNLLKQADTIEELCDEFVVYTPCNYFPITHLNYLGLDRAKEQGLEYKKNCDLESNIYGAIWTDKGLIYVAKMNEKGELELL